LLDAGFTGSGLAQLLRTGVPLNLPRAEIPRARLLLEVDRALDCLTTLLVLGDAVDATSAGRALGDHLETLVAARLVERRGDMICPLAQVIPHDEVLISSDLPSPDPDPLFVPGVQGPSDLLARLTPRRHVARALDLGTGCGIQAVLLSQHSEDVVATDINRRAIDVANRNAMLNRTARIDFRHGDLLEPVAGERFDLIVANPPYPISPEHTFVFRDAPVRGDQLCRRLIEAIPAALTDEGIAVVLVSWPSAGRTPDPLAWSAEIGCEALLLVTHVRSAIDDGLVWNHEHLHDAADYQDRVRRWWSFLDREGIGAVGYGALVLRRSAESVPWTAAMPFPPIARGAAGNYVLRLMDSHRALARAAGDVRALGPLVLAAGARLNTGRQRDAQGGWITKYELELSGGPGISAELDEEGAAIMSAFESPLTTTDALSIAARRLGPAHSIVATDAHAIVADALRSGLLELAV